MFRKLTYLVLAIFVIALVESGCEKENSIFESIEEEGGWTNDDGLELSSDCIGYHPEQCPWWSSLGQSGRNERIILEALYSVDQDIWGQNERIPCDFEDEYLWGKCCLMGDWDYSCRSNTPGWGGQCKLFVREILERASGGAATLPGGGIYDYRNWYPWRNRQDGIQYAQAGEIMQFTGALLHTAVIISNLGDGRFEIVDSNWCNSNKIAKHVIDVNDEEIEAATLRFYVIDCY